MLLLWTLAILLSSFNLSLLSYTPIRENAIKSSLCCCARACEHIEGVEYVIFFFRYCKTRNLCAHGLFAFCRMMMFTTSIKEKLTRKYKKATNNLCPWQFHVLQYLFVANNPSKILSQMFVNKGDRNIWGCTWCRIIYIIIGNIYTYYVVHTSIPILPLHTLFLNALTFYLRQIMCFYCSMNVCWVLILLWMNELERNRLSEFLICCANWFKELNLVVYKSKNIKYWYF